MAIFLQRYKHLLSLFLLYIIASIIVAPWGNFPLNDDWSYAKSVVKFNETGKIDIGDWPAMTLATHILWGFLFVKVLGFSFLVLRLSTWVSMVIGIIAFFQLGLKISGKKQTAFLMSVVLMFNPIYFNMTNTFMTDVNFLTLLILCAYVGYSFFENGKLSTFLWLFPLSVALILLRQYGIIVPAALFGACFLRTEKRWQYVIAALIMLVLVYTIFQWYESYLRGILAPWSAYKFSSNINPTRRLFWDNLWYGISTRYKIVLTHMSFHTLVFSIAFLPNVFKKFNWKTILLVFLAVSAWVVYAYYNYPLQVGNVFLDSAVGTDTSYETLVGTYKADAHFYDSGYWHILDTLKYLFNALTLTTFVLALILVFKKRQTPLKITVSELFLVFLFLAYLVMILITDSFFDRYQIPVIALTLLLYGRLYKWQDLSAKWAIVPFLALFYVSVLGTRDYFTWNTVKWAAVDELITKEHIPSQKIHGGFEQVCWNQGNSAIWYDFSLLYKCDYLVQYQVEDSFQVYRVMPIQRWLPPKMDTMRVFKRTIFAKGKGSDTVIVNQ